MTSQEKHEKDNHAFDKKFIYVLASVFLIFTLSYTLFSLSQPSNDNVPSTFELKAAIIDQLSLTAPNQTFLETTTTSLEQAGYTVQYYPGEQVNVDLYRNLPNEGYSLIILRVHSSLVETRNSLFTSEPFSWTNSLLVSEYSAGKLSAVAYSIEDAEKGQTYFGIRPTFVYNSMKGTFNNTIVVMMGCSGLNNSVMAEAFIQKGAKAYISWSQDVLASRTDSATEHLIWQLLREKQTIGEAVRITMEKVGPDPLFKSELQFYPTYAENYSVQEVLNSSHEEL